jgi:hypothetical protein
MHFVTMLKVNVATAHHAFCHYTGDVTTLKVNVTTARPITNVAWRNVSITYTGGGVGSDVERDPDHDANDGGPRGLGVSVLFWSFQH